MAQGLVKAWECLCCDLDQFGTSRTVHERLLKSLDNFHKLQLSDFAADRELRDEFEILSMRLRERTPLGECVKRLSEREAAEISKALITLCIKIANVHIGAFGLTPPSTQQRK